MPSLTVVDLSGNSLTEIKGSSFTSVPALYHVYLQNNKIDTLSLQAFSGLTSVKVINLESNLLATVDWSVFSPSDWKSSGGHPTQLQLSLAGNSMQCGERLCWMKQVSIA